jgi:phosphoribosyl 1,2-cyclic phosphate phosphodiesterase
MKLTILGSGTSHGVPMLGCACPVCRSEDPRDKRLRASLYIEGGQGERAVIDTGPEFRIQALEAGINRLDALFLTHPHADHLHGMDDVRPLSREKPLPVYGNRETLGELRERFSYVFRETQRGGGKPRLLLEEVSGPVRIGGLSFTPIPVKHGALDILGWKIEEAGASGVAQAAKYAVYLTDTSGIPAASRPLIGRPEILIIGGLRQRPHETHFSFEEALAAAVEMGARHTWLTHICHDCFHEDIADYCRRYREEKEIAGLTMEPAYDGLELNL